MTQQLLIPSKNFDVWGRLYTRYTLEPFPVNGGEPPGVLKTITPVTQADELLKRHRGLFESGSPTATGYVTVMTIPAGIRRQLITLRLTLISGTYTFNAIAVQDASEGNLLPIESFNSATTQIMIPLTAPITLDEGDTIQAFVNAFTDTGPLQLETWCVDEDAY